MNEFNSRAQDWDNNPIYLERSETIANGLLDMIPINREMKALEYGAGTGTLSFLLSDKFSEITLMDNSEEMVKVMHEKITNSQLSHLKPLFWDLVQNDYDSSKFDCIYSQMVLHHIPDTEVILCKWQQMLNPGGYLAIADLFTEDGSFHQIDKNLHFGFDPEKLDLMLKSLGFKEVKYTTCYIMKRPNGRSYPLFLLVARI
ncbi:MAG: class I SAM-dependent methyltransferase [Bacteroidales bacterium]|nr:class I SAM-dependent methyltransferase [Bacteroidales bacterium]